MLKRHTLGRVYRLTFSDEGNLLSQSHSPPIKVISDPGAKGGGQKDSHMNPHLCSPKDPLREEVTPLQDSRDLPYLQHLSLFQVGAYTPTVITQLPC